MPKIVLSFDILNTNEIIDNKRGKIMGWFASKVKNEDALKRLVEKKVSEEVVARLRKSLDESFKEEGILAHLKISVEE